MRVKYRMGDMRAPQTDNAEALQLAMQHFSAHCIATGETPICDGEAGIRVVRVLEAAQASLRREGASISLASGLSPDAPPQHHAAPRLGLGVSPTSRGLGVGARGSRCACSRARQRSILGGLFFGGHGRGGWRASGQ